MRCTRAPLRRTRSDPESSSKRSLRPLPQSTRQLRATSWSTTTAAPPTGNGQAERTGLTDSGLLPPQLVGTHWIRIVELTWERGADEPGGRVAAL